MGISRQHSYVHEGRVMYWIGAHVSPALYARLRAGQIKAEDRSRLSALIEEDEAAQEAQGQEEHLPEPVSL